MDINEMAAYNPSEDADLMVPVLINHVCGIKPSYDSYYDADFCKRCDKWISKACDDPDCLYHCTTRPEKPSQVKEDH